ncbi:hypothetical protein [Leucobacter sp. USHLN154]|uniref:hypothetical protein n=1 Tax=Leucobacter sp. USHLN154 TaxID=3081269 RepID=UPI00301AD1CD
MNITAFTSAVLLTTLTFGAPAAAVDDHPTTAPEVVEIDDVGIHHAPLQWFADAVIVPGDSDERTILVENNRKYRTTVSVSLSDVQLPTDESFLRDLHLRWGTSAESMTDIVAPPPPLAENVTLAPGERLPVILGYAYSEEATQVPYGTQSLRFTLTISATDPRPQTGSDTAPREHDRGPLATTGAQPGLWCAWALLALVGGGWLVAARRKRRGDEEADDRPVIAEPHHTTLP